MAKQFRRLASEHASLNSTPPPDYILPESTHDDLTLLDTILVGPVGTPYEHGAFRVVVKCGENYPNAPPTANFKTKIWHPNVDDKTGEVCVDTLKTAWTSSTTLRNVLEVIRSLLINPNPSSALNSEAGLLAEEDFRAFSREARLMTKIYAAIPQDLKAAVKAIRQKADEAGLNAKPVSPVARHRKTSSAGRRPSSASGKRSFEAMNEHAALSIPQSSSHADNALHTPTKDNFTNPQVVYSPSHSPTFIKSSVVKHPTSAESMRMGKENTCSALSPSRSRSSSPLGKRTFDEANEDASLETNIRGDIDRSMSPPPAKRRSIELERPVSLGIERPKKAPKSVVYSKNLKSKGSSSVKRGLRRL